MFKKVSVPPATSKGAGGHGQKTPLQEPHGGGFRARQAGLGPHRRCRDTHHSAALSSSGLAAERPQRIRLQPGIPGEGAPRRGIGPRLLRAHTGTY